MDASISDSALSHTRRSDAAEKREGNCVVALRSLLNVFTCWQVSSPRLQGCKSQAWQIGPGRSGPQILVDWAGPVRPEFQPGRAVPTQKFCGPGRFSPIFREYLLRKMLNLKWVNNKFLIFFKTSFKNTDRYEIGNDRLGPRFQLGRAVTAQDFCGPGRYGPRIKLYNPARLYRLNSILLKRWGAPRASFGHHLLHAF